jgi:nicotinamidase-related amidase
VAEALTDPSKRPSLCRADLARLVVVDVQVRLAAAMPAQDRERVQRNLTVLVPAARALQVPVVATEQYPRGLGATEPELARLFAGEVPVVEKTTFSCCGADGFLERLSPTPGAQAVIAGMETHVCVLQTAFDLQARGMQVFVVADAVCSRDPRNHEHALQRLRHAGVVVTSTESVVFEWLGDARHPRFKELSALLK